MLEIDTDRGFLLDGYPRNVEQAETLDRFLKVNLAIQLKLPDDEAVRRLMGRQQCTGCRSIFHVDDAPPVVSGECTYCRKSLMHRDDDREEIIRTRLSAYHFMTEPLASYYRQRGVLLAVRAGQPLPLLFQELVRKIAKLGFVS